MEHIITAILTMSGRVTMLGISRWTGKGGSYRTVYPLQMEQMSGAVH